MGRGADLLLHQKLDGWSSCSNVFVLRCKTLWKAVKEEHLVDKL